MTNKELSLTKTQYLTMKVKERMREQEAITRALKYSIRSAQRESRYEDVEVLRKLYRESVANLKD